MADAEMSADADEIEEVEPRDETAAADEFALPPPQQHHAVWIMSMNMGSCNGCDQQIQAMLAPRYQLNRRGITFAASPRHADIILLTGTLTRRSLEPVKRVLAQVPDPHALIAVGDCVLNGSVFAASPEIIANAADELAVNVEIAGNPPTPSQIVLAIEEAARLLDSADEPDDESDDVAEEEVATEDDVAGEADDQDYEEGDLTEDDVEADDVEGKEKKL